jgi:hypothetical protein
MKTALQELMQWFNERPQYDKTSEGYEIMQKAQELLASEKEHVMMAFNDGKVSGIFKQAKTADQYYKLTYQQ